MDDIKKIISSLKLFYLFTFMNSYLIYNTRIINEKQDFIGSLLIRDGKIHKIIEELEGDAPLINNKGEFQDYKVIDGTGKLLLPGIIDTHVHFREPGLEHKADIYTETKAAIAGGITSYMEMPNTIPQATTIDILEKKYELAAKKSLSNYSFFLGASNNNYEEIQKIDPALICGIKLFLGSSTGNMITDNFNIINEIFKNASVPIVIHAEDEEIINKNTEFYKNKFGENIPIKLHSKIRSAEACFKTTAFAVELAKKYNTKIHIAHLSTAKELSLFTNSIPTEDKKITTEVSIHHLWFDEADYEWLGTRIKCNPSIKTKDDKNSLLSALINNTIDIIATDHAPHTLSEKNNNYLKAPSGIPTIQYSLPLMLEFYHKNKISLNKIVEKMCHQPATIFNIHKRGFIKEKYWADVILIDLNNSWKVDKENIISKCKWSPFEGEEFKSKITHTFVNGNLVFENGVFAEQNKGKRLLFK